MTFQKSEFLFGDLSYKINGIAFKVHNQLGGGLLEIAYQKAMEIELKNAGLQFIPQKQIAIMYFESKVTSQVPDLIVENKIVIELKRRRKLMPDDFEQARRYLMKMKLQLSLLTHFGQEYVSIKRVVNEII